MTLDQAKALLDAAEKSSLHAYIVLSLLTGIRPEEARALRWDHVDLDGDPPHVDVFRSVRRTATPRRETSRRTLAIPEAAVEALRTRRARRHRTGSRPVLSGRRPTLCSPRTSARTQPEQHPPRLPQGLQGSRTRVRLGAEGAKTLVRLPYVSGGVPVEEIARLAGHRLPGRPSSSTARNFARLSRPAPT